MKNKMLIKIVEWDKTCLWGIINLIASLGIFIPGLARGWYYLYGFNLCAVLWHFSEYLISRNVYWKEVSQKRGEGK